jgi:hypothetical protein
LARKLDKEETRIQAEAKFRRKEAQAGAKAMADYEVRGSGCYREDGTTKGAPTGQRAY